MTDDQISEARFQLRTGQLIGGAVVTGIVGGLFALAASALAGSAFVAAVRRRLDQMDSPPSAKVRQSWTRARAAASARLGAGRNGQLAAEPQPQPQPH